LLELLEKELTVHRIKPISRHVCVCDGTKMTVRECSKKHRNSAQLNKKIILRMWAELCELLRDEDMGSPDPKTAKLFIPALQGLYRLSCCFPQLEQNGTVSCLKDALNRDSDSFSGRTMGKVVEFKLTINWLHHLIRRDLYICALLEKFRDAARGLKVEARGVAGPWANLDLPMLERTFPWEDVEEETAGREKDKRHQRRYELGLENYGEGDTTPNEGFYWREIRNEPYAFDDEDETLYPHRNVLWN
tara:strand:+ start:242414 stop:243154 length:741 start_codon:yes stop_codon:yes gene_type:complete